MNKIWINYYSVHDWTSPDVWDPYFRALETLLGDKLHRLDERDPVRRKVDNLEGQGAYVSSIPPLEGSRWVYGKFEKTKVTFSVLHYRDCKDYFGRPVVNDCTIYVPPKALSGKDDDLLPKIATLGCEHLRPFYMSCDFNEIVNGYRRLPETGIQSEIPGIFWLTYFGAAYVDFFGRDRIRQLPEASDGALNGLTLRLAEKPELSPPSRAAEIEEFLGEMSFARHGQKKSEWSHIPFIPSVTKAKGQYALTIETLRAWDAADGRKPD